MTIVDTAVRMIMPIIEEYIRILRSHGLNYPRRSWSRNGSGHKVEISFWVDMVKLPNGIDTPGPIMTAIRIDDELVFRAKIGGSAAFTMMDGLRYDTAVDADVYPDTKWLDILKEHTASLTREARRTY